MAQFEIVEMTAEGPQSANLGVFPDGKIAASIIPALLIQYPNRKFQPRPIKDDTTDWRAREQDRMAGREPLPWDVEPYPDHFAHRDPHNVENVIFTPDEVSGKLDRRSSIHCRVYLHRYFDLDEDERREMVWAYTGHEARVKFATDADTIYDVYKNGPSSCMAYPADNFATDGTHPSWCYSGPDLSIAYLGSEEDGYNARAVVWADKKIVGRIYGDSLQLLQALEELGYRQTHEQNDWQGARMRTRWVSECWDDSEDEYTEGYIMPYLDFAYNIRIEDDADGCFAVVDEWGTTSARGTNGLAADDSSLCRCCSTSVPSSKIGYAEDTHASMCNRCLEAQGYVKDVAGGRWFPKTSNQIFALAGGDYVQTRWMQSDSYTFVCPVTKERWWVRRGVTINERRYSPDGARLLEERKQAA